MLLVLDLGFGLIELDAEHTILIGMAIAAFVIPFATKVSFEGVEVELRDEGPQAALPEGRDAILPLAATHKGTVNEKERTQ